MHIVEGDFPVAGRTGSVIIEMIEETPPVE
jgi:hypothetical protein